MAHAVAGTNVYPANLTIPDDGDLRDASSVNPAFEGLANRTAFLKAHMVDGVDGGSYTPAAPIAIGGAGLAVSGPAALSGATFDVAAGTTSTIHGNVTFSAGKTVQLQGSTEMAGCTLKDAVLKDSTAYIVDRWLKVTALGSFTFHVSDGDVIYFDVTNVANQAYTILTGGALTSSGYGPRVRFCRPPTVYDGFELSIVNNLGTALGIFSYSHTLPVGHYRSFMELMIIDGGWKVIGGDMI